MSLTPQLNAQQKQVKPKVALLIILGTVASVLILGLSIGYMFFWNAYDKDTKLEHEFKIAKAKVNAEPNNVQARLELGWSFVQQEKYDKALEQYQNVLKLEPKNMVAKYNIALLKLQNNDLAGAKSDLEAVKAEDPKYVEARGSLGLVYMETAEYAKAIEELELYNAFKPGNVDILYKLGQAYEKTGQKERAKTSYQNALKYNPNDGQVSKSLAELK